ncbi:hypothetical protein ACYZTX_24630 [Pseudomonas sp. MDT1-17]
MAKKKTFVKTDISIPQVKLTHEKDNTSLVFAEELPPLVQVVIFRSNTTKYRKFDFSPWYQVGIDEITYACQIQISRFLAGQDIEVETITVTQYCRSGLRPFLNYLTLRAVALERVLTLADFNRGMIDGFLAHLADFGTSINTQKTTYNAAKTVLATLGRRGVVGISDSGDDATFPRNPFPNSNRFVKGETSLSKNERTKFANAIKTAVMPIWDDSSALNGHLLACAFLVVALHTGRNATPLLEMSRDCLRNHPKDNSVFLVLWKRRGQNTSKVILRANSNQESILESTPTLTTNIERLIRRIISLTSPLLIDAPDHVRGRVWIYSSNAHQSKGKVLGLTPQVIDRAFKLIAEEYDLMDDNGDPLRVNLSRLRKTFGNRIFELSNGDIAATAAALGNSPKVADEHYLKPDVNTKKNWKFLGEVLVQELLSNTIGATYKETPMGKCSDTTNGQYAPKNAGATCMSFLNCLRCMHYAITSDDLYKLFSFYYRIYEERSRMDKRRWGREYAHIPRLIDDYIVAEGLKRGVFKAAAVNEARERARIAPHPFWSVDLITTLEIIT